MEEEGSSTIESGAPTAADRLVEVVDVAVEGHPFQSETVDLDLARAYGRSLRADLAVDMWAKECAKDSDFGCSEDVEDDAIGPALPPAPDLYSVVLECCVGSGDFESAVRIARMAGWRAPPVIPGDAGQAAS